MKTSLELRGFAKEFQGETLDCPIFANKQLLILATMVCAALAHCFSLGVAAIGFSAVAILIYLFLDVDQCLISLYVCLPFFNVMTIAVGTTSLYYLLVIIFIAKFVTSKRAGVGRNKIVLLLCVVLFTLGNIDDLSKYVRWILVFIPLVLTFNTTILSKNLVSLITWYSVSSILSACFGYYLSEHGLLALTSSYVYTEGGNLNRFGGLVGDPVMFSETLVLLFACNIVLMLKGEGAKWTGLIAIGLAVPCALSYSKSALLLIAALVLFSIAYLMTHQMLKRETILKGIFALCLIALAIIAVVICASSNQAGDLMSGLMRRFESNDLTTGRLALWSAYWSWLQSQDIFANLFGVGFLAYSETAFPYAGILLNRCHNVYLETWILFGGVGAVAAIGALSACVVKALMRKVELAYFIPLLILAVFGIVLHGHTESFYYFLWIIALGMVRMPGSAAKRRRVQNGA